VLLPRQEHGFRHYDLRYETGLRNASLWIDGQQIASGYLGHTQFQEDWGVIFGANLYRGPRAMGTFQMVRFAINP